MRQDLLDLLKELAILVPLYLLIGLRIRKTRPEWCKAYAKWCLDRKWWFFLFGVVLFSCMVALAFSIRRHLYGVIFIIFALLEAWGVFAYGFKRLTPEIEAKIDTSDPTKIFPLSFWKERAKDKDEE